MSSARRFTKSQSGVPADFFEAEARGLDRLRVPGGPPIPAVHEVGPDRLVLDHITTGAPSVAAAAEFGRRLAVLHRAGGTTFGADADGYVATIPLDNAPTATWAEFHAVRRLRPVLGQARDVGAITASDADAVDQVISALPELAGPVEPAARIHGDLWAGNLLWSVDGEVWLIDAAASCDAHRETDLAMLALFGAPMLAEIVAAYDDAYPLSDGWEGRVALHQLHPLLVHAVLFGSDYGSRAGAAARRAIG
jgi:fructosamine-3-kinase